MEYQPVTNDEVKAYAMLAVLGKWGFKGDVWRVVERACGIGKTLIGEMERDRADALLLRPTGWPAPRWVEYSVVTQSVSAADFITNLAAWASQGNQAIMHHVDIGWMGRNGLVYPRYILAGQNLNKCTVYHDALTWVRDYLKIMDCYPGKWKFQK